MSEVLERMSKLEHKTLTSNEFYKEVKETLKYDFGWRNETNDEMEERLLLAMEKHQIFPFKEESVKNYMKSAAKKANWNETKYALFFSLGIGLASLINFYLAFMIAGYITFGLAVISLAIFTIATFFDPVYKWQRLLLDWYSRPIPEFALQTAMDLKKEVPEVCFLIEELAIRQNIDPFLVVYLPSNKHYYIEVWNEPGFKNKKEV